MERAETLDQNGKSEGEEVGEVSRKKQGNTMFFASFLFLGIYALRCAAPWLQLRCMLGIPSVQRPLSGQHHPCKGLISSVQERCIRVGDCALVKLLVPNEGAVFLW